MSSKVFKGRCFTRRGLCHSRFTIPHPDYESTVYVGRDKTLGLKIGSTDRPISTTLIKVYDLPFV